MSTLCAGCGHDSVTAAIVRAFYEPNAAAHDRQAVGHRLLLEDADLLRRGRARVQLGARAHAVDRHRRQRRQPLADLHRHLGRRRFAVDRRRPAGARHPPQRRHAVRHREQRRVRPDQGAVLRVGGHRHQEQEGEANAQPPSIRCRWRWSWARPSSPAGSPATRRSWCRMFKAGLAHKGFALIDVISPCVTFNDHAGRPRATRTRARSCCRSSPPTSSRTRRRSPPSTRPARSPPSPSTTAARSASASWTPTGIPRNRQRATDELERHRAAGEVPTGLFFVDPKPAATCMTSPAPPTSR